MIIIITEIVSSPDSISPFGDFNHALQTLANLAAVIVPITGVIIWALRKWKNKTPKK